MTVVVLHGFTGSGGSMAGLVDRLSGVCLAPDLIGHGDAGAPADLDCYRMPAMISDVAELAAPHGPVDLVGYSMGARVALSLAVERPEAVRTLVLIGGTAGIDDPEEAAVRVAADEELADRIESSGLPWFVDFWETRPIFATQEALPADVRAGIRAGRLRQSAIGLANHLRGAGTGAMPSLWSRLGEVAIPTLLVVGELDLKFAAIAHAMAEQLADATVVVVPGVGHAAHVEAPSAVAEEIERFWSRR